MPTYTPKMSRILDKIACDEYKDIASPELAADLADCFGLTSHPMAATLFQSAERYGAWDRMTGIVECYEDLQRLIQRR